MEKVIVPVCSECPTTPSSLSDFDGESTPNADCNAFLNWLDKSIPNPVGRESNDDEGLLDGQDTNEEI